MRSHLDVAALALLVCAADAKALGAKDEARGPERPDGGSFETVVTADPYDPARTGELQFHRSDLDRQGARSAAEVLERTPSVYATTGGRNERIFSIRGFDQRQTAVLVDGAPAFIAYDGQVDLGMLPPELIERITVSRGPGTLAVGPNGLGPTVSIITRRPGAGPFLQGQLEGALPGTWRAGAIHSQQLKSAGYTVYAGGEQSHGFRLSSGFAGTPLQAPGIRLNSDRKGWYAGGSAMLEPAPSHEVAVTASYVDGDKGVPPSTLDDTPRFWRFNTWRGVTASVGHAYRAKVEVEELAYARVYDNLLDGYDDQTFSTQSSARAFHTWYHDRSVGLVLRARAPLPEVSDLPSQLRAFANVAYDYHSADPSLPAFQRVLLTGAPEIAIDLTTRLAATLGCQVDAELPIDLRGESSRAPVGAGPLAELRYEVADGLSTGAAVGLRHRFPSLKERFSRALGTRLPNADLRPESAWHFDADAAWRAARWLSLDASAFDAEVTDLIDRIYLGGGIDQLQNIAKARLAGAELSARAKVKPWLRAELGYAYLWAHRLDQTPDVLPYRPAHKAGVGLIASPSSWLEASTFVRVVGPQGFQAPTTLGWGTLGGYAVWDARIEARPWPEVALYARATNLLDMAYQTEYGFPDPGRQLWVGVRVGTETP